MKKTIRIPKDMPIAFLCALLAEQGLYLRAVPTRGGKPIR